MANTSSSVNGADNQEDGSNNVNNSGGNSNGNGEKSTGLDRSKLRMRDLLYYNPRNKKQSDSSVEINQTIQDTSTNFNENENSQAESIISSSASSISSSSHPPTVEASNKEKPAAPQLKIAEDGSIIIDANSLLIEREHVEPVYDSTVVESGEHNDNLTYNSYRKFHHTKKWTEKETAKFYKALSMIGTDFTMIQRLFTNRNRDEIKRKFKREEKLNQALIDKILSKTSQIDLSIFVSSGSEQEQERAGANENQSGEANVNNVNKKKKPKLKRIKKREFIESESEDEKLDENNKNSKSKRPLLKTKKTTRAENRAEETAALITEAVMRDASLSSVDQTQASVSVLNSEPENIKEPTAGGGDLDENNSEQIELIFDLDSNCVQEVIKNENFNQNKPPKEEENNDDDDEEIIFDLDTNTVIRNNEIVKIDQSSALLAGSSKDNEAAVKASPTKAISKITITKNK